MERALRVSGIVLLLITVAGSAAMAQEKHPISQASFDRMIQIAPLVFQGKVTKVEVKLITPKELFGVRNKSVHIPMTEVTMEIEKIIAGEYESDEIVIVLPEGRTVSTGHAPTNVNVGDHAIVAFKLNSLGTGLNVLDRPERFFRVEGTKLIPYMKELYLAVDNPLELLVKKAEERRMTEMFEASDLICTGTVAKLVDVDSLSGRLIVSIDETLKGTAEESEITVDMPDVPLPSTLEGPGFRVMLFLKKDGSRYRPVAGINGYFVMNGENLTSGQSTPVWMSAGQLKSYIEMWNEDDK